MRIAAVLLPLALAACAVPLPIDVAELPAGTGAFGEADLSTYLFMSGEPDGTGSLLPFWHEPLDTVLHRDLERRGYFSKLHFLEGSTVPLKLHVAMRKTRAGGTPEGVAGEVLVVGSGGVVPLRIDWRYEAQFSLRCRGQAIGQWSYGLQASELVSLWGPPLVGRDLDVRAVLSFVPRFLRDVVAAGVAPGECR